MMDYGFSNSAALALVQAKDGQALSRQLLELLEKVQWAESAEILEVFGLPEHRLGISEDLLEQVAVRPFDPQIGLARSRAVDDRGLRQCLLSGSAVIVPPEANAPGKLVLPVPGRCNPARILVVKGISQDPAARVQLLQMLDIYGNQAELLDSRERDQLTGLLNRQAFTERFLQMIAMDPNEFGAQMWLAVLDIDHFKRINDNYGHLYGDEVLLRFAQLMERNFRYCDPLFRFGGEEFVVLLRTDDAGVLRALDRFRIMVEEHEFPGVDQVTVSIGYAVATPGILPADLVDQADQGLYAAKRGGRNRIICSDLQIEERTAGNVELF